MVLVHAHEHDIKDDCLDVEEDVGDTRHLIL